MALKAGRVGVAPSQVNNDGTLNIVIPDPPEPPEPTPATKIYKKEFTLDKDKMAQTQIVENVLYLYQTNATTFPIVVEGYTPIAVKIIDRYTGYTMAGACIADNLNNGIFNLNFFSKYHGSSSDFAKAVVYYVKNTDLETLS